MRAANEIDISMRRRLFSRRHVVCVMLYIDDPLSSRADLLFAHLTARWPAVLRVPDLFCAECLSAPGKHMLRCGHMTLSRDVDALRNLALRVTLIADMTQEAAAIMMSYGVSACDAFYAALAGRVGVPLITADERLVRALAGSPYDAQSLATCALPALS